MIVESTVGNDKVRGSNAIFETSVFTFVACFVVFSTSLTFMFHQLIVASFWDSLPLVQSIQIWFGRRRRKPPDKVSFPFRGDTFRRLIVMSVSGSKPRGPKENPLCPSGLAQSIRIWFGRRQRKPPDKNLFPFRDLAFRRLIVACVSGSKPRGPKESPFDPSAAARTISDSAIEYARQFERLPDSSGPDPATSIPNRIGKSPRRCNVAIGVIAGHRARQCRH